MNRIIKFFKTMVSIVLSILPKIIKIKIYRNIKILKGGNSKKPIKLIKQKLIIQIFPYHNIKKLASDDSN